METDRLAEEKRRGISIEVGFAHFRAPSGRAIALVDVPGHERFVRNMLAGVSGIDLVLLIVAADESVKPQTREHFDICRLLGLERGIVVLTKTDLVDDDILGLVELEVAELVRGSFLENSPLVRVSATRGVGIAELASLIDQLAGQGANQSRRSYPRLPIDRVFTVRGHGTVVTGTLRDAPLEVESELEIYTSGQRTRVRGMEVHGQTQRRAAPGYRTALNLTGVDVGEIRRGMVLAPPEVYRASRILDARIEVLSSARPLKDRAPLHFYSGAMECEAELRLLESTKSLLPGQTGFVRIVLREAALLLPADRFILRSFSPVATIAGGVVLDLRKDGERLKRKGEAERLAEWIHFDTRQRSRSLVESYPLGVAASEICQRLGCAVGDLDPYLEILKDGWLVAPSRVNALSEALVGRLAQHHRSHPLEPGYSREACRSEMLSGAPPSLLEHLLARSGKVAAEGEFLRLSSHRVQLAASEGAALAQIEESFRAAGILVPALDEVLAQSGQPPAKAKAVLAVLLRSGQLVRVGQALVFHRECLARLKDQIRAKQGQRFGVAEFKDWTGASRKYAIPLLEYLDKERVTRREGEQRLVL